MTQNYTNDSAKKQRKGALGTTTRVQPRFAFCLKESKSLTAEIRFQSGKKEMYDLAVNQRLEEEMKRKKEDAEKVKEKLKQMEKEEALRKQQQQKQEQKEEEKESKVPIPTPPPRPAVYHPPSLQSAEEIQTVVVIPGSGSLSFTFSFSK